ncbi:hypothetical protein [Chryseobacterium taiwanense]|uniref:hypothetical protein n=1 Tax=Chryseobacterium taiwanense TaxID=363331 RepID=UPI00068B28A0|nr:hypothetical protein [Chryseobacterium taiwanense]
MNPRVLELLKNPKNIQPEDINLLRGEIDAFPYVQNIRALHLFGVHLYEKENYQRELSTTAAYTTDKKILYQLINGKIQQKPKPKIQEPVVHENKIEQDLNNTPKQHFYQSSSFPLRRENETSNDTDDTSCAVQSGQEVTYVYVNGEKNRILFEGEENFLTEEPVQTITLSSDSLMASNHEVFEEIEEFEPETIIEEETITSEPEKEEILEDSELSFHETEASLSDIHIQGNEEQEIVIDEVKEENEAVETAEFTPEKIINEDKISSETENIQDKEELSFHGMESFLPEVKIQPNNPEEVITEILQPNLNKHEDEIRRLIEEVEKKMKEKAASEQVVKEEEPEITGHEISFAETQSFETASIVSQAKEEVEPENTIEEIQPEVVDVVEPEKESTEEKTSAEEVVETKSAWKPMSFESNLPDSLLNKPAETIIPKVESVQEEIPEQKEMLPVIEEVAAITEEKSAPIEEPVEELTVEEEVSEKTEENKEDVPVMNVSFFSSNWTIAQPEKEVQNIIEEKEEIKEEKVEETVVEAPKANLLDSNVPGFINTWQSWLKIDRTEEVEKEKVEIKAKAIESFIENNPKISQLREESTYVVKEKNDDISHLMTETLATLYFEQKLYTKAIKAFDILIKKNPEKEEYFKNKIQEIKDFRSKN